MSTIPEHAAKTPRARRRLSRERSRRQIVEATAELVRDRSYAELNVGEIMDRAGIGRTLFYRHFDDLADLVMRVARDAIDELYEAQLALAAARDTPDLGAVRAAIAATVDVYVEHGPLLRAFSEAAAADPLVRERGQELRARFDRLIASAIRTGPRVTNPPPDADESARALNRLSEGYLLDAFGREPRVSPELATDTLTDIWIGFVAHRLR
jgi:AcrR family transcriptional regulator